MDSLVPDSPRKRRLSIPAPGVHPAQLRRPGVNPEQCIGRRMAWR
jgi:hypothetical protein